MWIDRLSTGFGGDFLHDRRGGPLRLLAIWGDRIRQRRALADLDAALRSDVGLSSALIDVEIAKPFWRA